LEKIFITGISGYLGQKLLASLCKQQDIKQIVGIDIRESALRPDNFVFYKKDVRRPLADILSQHGINCLVHLAYVVPPLHDKRLMEDINIGGTRNVLDSCLKAGVKHIIYTSSATAYGFHADNDRPLTELSPLRGNDDFTYSKNKKEIEGIFSRFIQDNPDYSVAILRPSFVAGPVFDNPLARYLQKSLVLMPRVTPPFQYVHEDDLVEIICLILQKRVKGAFNVGADGSMTFPEMIRMLGNRSLGLPFGILYALNNLAWLLRLTSVSEFPSPALNMVRYPWIVSSEKLKNELGYRYKYTTRETFQDFAQAFKSGKKDK